ncbi:lipoprotein insertase outer membrane protein LolB [Panacagrimonas sp.]|uniref:lipoprotein insertase outer membrane protein LolB n=1 Tax=Panacagrimonas sp. TaxID=2480088 RepID=UPI003B52BE59
MIRALVLTVCLAVLPGCALLRTPPPEPASGGQVQRLWLQRANLLSVVTTFTVQGRVASSAVGFKADLRWKQFADDHFEMRVAGPFGARAAELSGTPERVRVRTGQDQPEVTTDPEIWLQEAIGVRLPVRGLRWWALGLPDPAAPHQLSLDAAGRALRIEQNGWVLDYIEYLPGGLLALPRRIDASDGNTRVIVLADQWRELAPLPDELAADVLPDN